MKQAEIGHKLEEIARLYPLDLVPGQQADIPRVTFQIAMSILNTRSPGECTICDIGGGIGLFSPGCAAIGFRKVFLVDDFADEINRKVGNSVFDVHRRFGVQVVSRDVVAEGLGNLGESLDVVTCFDSMEHWHHSPKKLFHELMAMLKPGGRFVLAVPNCVNLRKRLTVPVGRGKWSAMKDWYEPGIFRGHVREPDVQDLQYIAEDLGLNDVRILGCNWAGHQSGSGLVRVATKLLDPLMQLRPSLCSDIYLIGHKD